MLHIDIGQTRALMIGGLWLMKKLDLVIYEGQAHRVLAIKNDKCFVINCIKISMPFWVEMSCLEEKENLVLETITIDVLSPANKKIAYERYSLISCLNERQKK